MLGRENEPQFNGGLAGSGEISESESLLFVDFIRVLSYDHDRIDEELFQTSFEETACTTHNRGSPHHLRPPVPPGCPVSSQGAPAQVDVHLCQV